MTPTRGQIEQAYIDGSVEGSPIDRDGNQLIPIGHGGWEAAVPMLDRALNEVWQAAHPDAAQYIAERMYEDGWNVSHVSSAPALVTAAQEVVGSFYVSPGVTTGRQAKALDALRVALTEGSDRT